MHVAALLACLALASLALGVLGLARVGKPRRGLKSFERTCLLDPLSLPSSAGAAASAHYSSHTAHRLHQRPQVHDVATAAARATSSTRSETRSAFEETATFLTQLISPLLARVEQANAGAAILRFLHPHTLAHTALRFSGLSLLMANQQLPTASALDATNSHSAAGSAEAVAQAKQATPQPAWSSDGEGEDSDLDQYEEGSDSSDDDDDGDASFEDPRIEEAANAAKIAGGKNAQHALFDGLQFYTVLMQVGTAAVHRAMEQAVLNAADDVANQRAQASISAIEQRYPDILCLSAPSYLQRTTRADLASALLAVTTAATNHRTPQPCSSMQRHLSLKRPESLAFATGDAMETMTRSPLTSPSAQTQQQLETSFLQAA